MIFKTKEKTVKVDRDIISITEISHDLPKFDRVEVVMYGDTHDGDKFQDKRRVKRFLEEVKETENRYVIIGGDICNTATKGSVSDIYSEEFSPDEQIDRQCEALYPIKDKILVFQRGNHEYRIWKESGVDIMGQIAKRIYGESDKAEYERRISNDAYLMFLSFGKSHGRESRQTMYTFFGRHGHGGGSTMGGKANALERMSGVADADIYIHLHNHAPIAFRQGFFRVNKFERMVEPCDKLFVNANAFLFYGGYGARMGMKMASTVYPMIILDGRNKYAKALI